MSSPRIVLVGAAGAGKSTVAQILASTWEAPVLDTDALFEQDSGMTVTEAVVQDVDSFRKREQEIAAQALNSDGTVVVLGSGSVESPAVRDMLTDLPVVWLSVGLTEAARRAGLSQPRPASLGNVRARFQQMLDERATVYDAVARTTIPTDALTAEQVAEKIVVWEAGS